MTNSREPKAKLTVELTVKQIEELREQFLPVASAPNGSYRQAVNALCDLAASAVTLRQERDELHSKVGAADAANMLGGLVGVSAHDLHIQMERELSRQVQEQLERAETAEAERDEARRLLSEADAAIGYLCGRNKGCFPEEQVKAALDRDTAHHASRHPTPPADQKEGT